MKNMLLVVSLFTLSTYAMEKENKQENQWSVIVKKTKINLYKGNILGSGDSHKADVIIVKKSLTLKENSFLQNNKDKIREISESCIEISPLLDVSYATYKPTYQRYDGRLFKTGDIRSSNAVVEAALKDLKLRYTETLTQAILEKNEKMTKSIALPALSIGSLRPHVKNDYTLENKAAQCTVTTILEFINNNPDAYDCIDLFVEGDFEFNVCQTVLAKITKPE